MPGTSENIGGVSISITGDTSQLNAAFSSAQASAAAAGGKVASAFNAGAASVDELAGATVAAAAAEAGFARATEESTAALGHQVSQIQATSGALRTLEGTGGIRAAERFLTLIPGLGAALQYAFPVIGAIALAESITRVIGKSEELKAAEKELADATNKADEAFGSMERTLDRLNVEHIKNVFGAAAGTGAGATVLEQQTQRLRVRMDDLKDSINEVAYAEASSLKNYIPFHSNQASIDKLKALGQEYKKLAAILQETEGKAGAAREDQGRQASEQAGQLAAKRIESAEQASAREAEISKQKYTAQLDLQHAAETDRIAGLQSEYARVVQTGQEEIRFAKAKADEIAGYALATRDRTISEIAAKAGAESAGKSKPEQALIYAGAQADTSKAKQEYTLAVDKGALDSQKAQQAAALSLDQLNRRVAETLNNDVREGWDKVGAAAKQTQKAATEAAEKQIVALQRVGEIQDKGAGDQKALQIQAQKIALEGQYGAQVSHSLQQEIAYMQQIAALEHDERQAKIDGLAAELKDAEALDSQLRDLTKIATLKAEIANLSQQDANATASAAGKQTAVSAKASLGAQLGAAGQQGVGQLTSALAKGVMDGGKGLGKDIRTSLQGIGQQMLGDVLKKGTEELVIAVTGNTIATNLNTLWTQIQALAGAIGFADGTNSAPGGMAWVGEKGPEIMHVPRGAQIIPNHAIKGYASGTPGYQSSTAYNSTAFQTGTTELHFHAHGMTNPDQFIDHVMRKLPETLKRRSPQFSALSH